MSRSTSKDALAWTIIHGGPGLALAAAFAAAIAADAMTRGQAKALKRAAQFPVINQRKSAWEYYLKTGDIGAAVDVLLGNRKP